MTDPARRCGTISGYSAGCRCEPCSQAKWRYGRAYRQGVRLLPPPRVRSETMAGPMLRDPDMNWMDGAPCIKAAKQGVNFFPGAGEPTGPAIKVCCECDRIERCLDFAQANSERGIWGGTTERQRSRLRGNVK